MPMSEGQMQSLAAVARKHREQEAPLRERGDPAGLGIGAAALLIELAGDEIRQLRALCAATADQLQAAYGHLPRSEFPGPPETIIQRLHEAAGPAYAKI